MRTTEILEHRQPALEETPTWPSYSALGFNDIEGDPFVYGQVYGSSGRGVFTGMFNFLLKRDMDPASNDNDPMWLEKAA